MKVYIETERLMIRDPILEDFDAIWKMRNDDAVTQFTGGITKLSRDQAYERHIERCENFDDEPKEYAVILKESGSYLGYCGFQYCDILGGIELLYGYAKAYWGNGYAYEAAKAVIEFAEEAFTLDVIFAAVNDDNVASDKVLSKIGMTLVGKIEWPEQGLVKKYRYPFNR